MMQIIRFLYPYGTDASSLAEGAGWIQKRRCASTSGFLESAPAASGKGMAEPKSRRGERNAQPQSHRSKLCSCNSPWALTPAKQHSSKGYRPRQNKFVAPWAHIPSTTTCNNGYCPRRNAGTRQGM